MTFDEIEAFQAVVRKGTLSQAASSLFISQPALSRRIQTLEEELGYTLFTRQKGGRNITLTEEGQQFLELADRWLRLWEKTRAIGSGAKQKTLRISSFQSLTSYLLPAIIREFLQEDPNRSVEFQTHHSYVIYDAIESGMTDLAFTTIQRYARNVRAVPFFRDRFVLIMGKDAVPLPEPVDPALLNPRYEIYLRMNEDFENWHRKHIDQSEQPRLKLDQMTLLEEFLKGDSWTILPAYAGDVLRRKGFQVLELDKDPPKRTIFYLQRENEHNEVVEEFLNCMRDYIETYRHFDVVN